MEAVPKLAGHILTEMSKIIVGQDRLKTECLIVLLCEDTRSSKASRPGQDAGDQDAVAPAPSRVSARAMHSRPDAADIVGPAS